MKDIIKSCKAAVCGILILAVLLLLGCGEKEKPKLTIASQYGIAYAPLNIMEKMNLLDKYLEDVDVNWVQFGGPSAIRENMINGSVDFGFMGICPVLIGLDNGMDWKYATGISANEVALVTSREDRRSLSDFTAEDRIAVISPGSTQHVLLSMLAQKELGDATMFDEQIVAMSHPDAMSALLANTEITAHMATPPYIQEEVKAGMHVIATGEDMVSESFTFICGVAMEEFYESNREHYDGIIEALNEAIDFMNENQEEAAEILAPLYGITKEEFMEQMKYNGTIYSNQLKGIETIGQAMEEMGFIRQVKTWEETAFDNVSH